MLDERRANEAMNSSSLSVDDGLRSWTHRSYKTELESYIGSSSIRGYSFQGINIQKCDNTADEKNP